MENYSGQDPLIDLRHRCILKSDVALMAQGKTCLEVGIFCINDSPTSQKIMMRRWRDFVMKVEMHWLVCVAERKTEVQNRNFYGFTLHCLRYMIQRCFPEPFRLKFTGFPNCSRLIGGAQANVHRGPLCDEELLGFYTSLGVADVEMGRDEAIFDRPEATSVLNI